MSTTDAFHAVGDDGAVFLTLRDDARRAHPYARHGQVVPLTAELHHTRVMRRLAVMLSC